MDDVDLNTKTKANRAASAVGGTKIDFGLWLSNYNSALEHWNRSSGELMEKATELSCKMLDFSQGSLHLNLDAWQAFAACRTPEDFMRHQQAFMQKAAQQYFDQASNLVSSTLALVSSAAIPFHEGAATKS